MAKDPENIIFKTVKVKEEGAHGGAWKIAYADFVTAMMAFFLLLWLLNATSEEVQEGLSNYFQPTLQTTPSTSGSGGIFGGETANDPGPLEVTTTQAFRDSDSDSQTNLDTGAEASGRDDDVSSGDVGLVNAAAEEQSFMRIAQILETSIDELPPELQDLKESLKVDVNEDGLRIQILDHNRKASFERGSTNLTPHGQQAVRFVAAFVQRLPNKIAITGHTASDDGGDQNVWALSLQRANAVRRALLASGLPEPRTETVIGRGAADLANPDEPTAAENRRMSIVMLRQGRSPFSTTAPGGGPPPIIQNDPR
ncbi:MAG: OmpA family protein [Alphaproteobacteria bacterium]|nr:OmpA family protein [Alphaproteobacteria bacterium]